MAQTTFTVWNETQINAAIQAIGAIGSVRRSRARPPHALSVMNGH